MKKIKLLPLLFLIPAISFSQAESVEAMVDSLQFLKANKLDCTADLYWRIIAQKQSAIAFLIEKLNDTTQTNVSFHCKKTKLNVGEVAYMALDQIAEFPTAYIIQQQFDVVANGCWSFYDYFFVNANKSEYQQQVRDWYINNRKKFTAEKIASSQLNACQLTFKISVRYKWKQ